MELSNIQKEIVQTNKDKVVVMASAASGKTRCITERALYLIENGANPKDMVIITFTNLAAEEMLHRLGDKAHGAFIGTIHALAYYWLVRGGFDVGNFIENNEFDQFFPLIEKHSEVIQPVKYLIVDEFQDCNQDQISFMFDMIKPEKWMIVGDIKQSMYRFNNARPDLMISIMDQSGVYTYDMDENYRNGHNILAFAKRVISALGYDYADYSVAMRDEMGAVLQLENYEAQKLADYVKLHMDREGENYKDWFILSRTNQERDILFDTFKQTGIPADTFKKSEMTNGELRERMAEDTVKILTIHQAKGLENKCVAVVGAKYYNEEERCISYVAATRARDVLVWCKPKKKEKKRKFTAWE